MKALQKLLTQTQKLQLQLLMLLLLLLLMPMVVLNNILYSCSSTVAVNVSERGITPIAIVRQTRQIPRLRQRLRRESSTAKR